MSHANRNPTDRRVPSPWLQPAIAARCRAFWVRRILRRPIVWADRYGLRYRLQPSDDLALYFLHRGWFEEPEQEFCRQFVTEGMTVLDVGAYIGMFTCLFGRLVGRSGQVHAFEPSPRTYERLAENVALNGLDNVVLNREAVFSHRETRPLFVYPAPLESLSSLVRERVDRSDGTVNPLDRVAVRTVTLDDYCLRHGINSIDLVKVDAEGAEEAILAGAGALLRRAGIRALLFEIGPQSAELARRLEAADFDVSTLDKQGVSRPASLSDVLASRTAVARHRSWPWSGTT